MLLGASWAAFVVVLPLMATSGVPTTSPVRLVLAVSTLSVLLALVLRRALRPPHLPGSAKGSTVVFLLALAFPVQLAIMPRRPRSSFDASPDVPFVEAAATCLLVGATIGGLLLIGLRALDRGAHGSLRTALLAAAGGGLAGNLALELHCPSTAPAHLLVGHAAVGLVLVAFYGLVLRARGT
jgi:hypothetical protein